jgi:hypothetical protein
MLYFVSTPPPQGLHTLCSIFREKDHKIVSVDLAGNDLTAEHIQFIKMSLAANKYLTAIDLRRNPGYNESEWGDPAATSLYYLMCISFFFN